jgi:hypothetical protein
LWIWAAVIVAYDFGALAVTFNYPLFIGQGGMEFWLLNAALFTGAQRSVAPEAPRLGAYEKVPPRLGGLRPQQGHGHGELRPGLVTG